MKDTWINERMDGWMDGCKNNDEQLLLDSASYTVNQLLASAHGRESCIAAAHGRESCIAAGGGALHLLQVPLKEAGLGVHPPGPVQANGAVH